MHRFVDISFEVLAVSAKYQSIALVKYATMCAFVLAERLFQVLLHPHLFREILDLKKSSKQITKANTRNGLAFDLRFEIEL